MKNAKVIAIGNQKGGVGKTTNSAHLAAALGSLGNLVLAWDLDVNYGLTSHFGIPEQAYTGTFHVLTGEREVEDVILTNDDPDIDLPQNVHVIASSRELEQINQYLSKNDPFFTPHTILQEPIAKLRSLYDYIILDTAPNTYVATTVASYISADYFIISTLPERLALEGMKNALKDVQRAQRVDRNPNLRLLGVIVSGMDKRIRKAREYDEAIRVSFKETGQENSSKFESTISRAAAISRAQASGQTVLQSEPNHRTVGEFISWANEVEKRVEEFEAMSQDGERRLVNG